MNWTSDPPHRWVAVYRVVIIILLLIQIFLSSHRHEQIKEGQQMLATVIPEEVRGVRVEQP